MYCVSAIITAVHITSPSSVISTDHVFTAVTFLNISEYFYLLTVITLKISLAVFFHRLATKKWHRSIIYFAVGSSTLYTIGTFFFAVFQCGVYDNVRTFIFRRLTGRCVDNTITLTVIYGHAAVTMCTDWIFLLLPIALLKNSSLKGSQKLTVLALLMLASVSCFASINRFRFINSFAVPKGDFFRICQDIAVWSGIESGGGIAAGNLVTLRPLFRSWLQRGGSEFATERSGMQQASNAPSNLGNPTNGSVISNAPKPWNDRNLRLQSPSPTLSNSSLLRSPEAALFKEYHRRYTHKT